MKLEDIVGYINIFKDSDRKLSDLLNLIRDLDEFIKGLPTPNITNYIDDNVDIDKIRLLWFSGKSVKELKK